MVELLKTRLDTLPAGETVFFRLGDPGEADGPAEDLVPGGPGEADGLLKAGEELVPGGPSGGLVANTVEVSVRCKLGRADPSCVFCASCELIVQYLRKELVVGRVLVTKASKAHTDVERDNPDSFLPDMRVEPGVGDEDGDGLLA